MTGARLRGLQQEGKAYFSVSLRDHMSFKLDLEHIQNVTHNFLLYSIQNTAAQSRSPETIYEDWTGCHKFFWYLDTAADHIKQSMI